MKSLLRFAGKNGAWVVVGGIVAGFLIPSLSAIARPYLAVAIFLFTFGSFLKLDLESFRNQFVHTRATFAMVLWATFGVPIAVLGIITLFKPGADVTQGLLFWSLVPTSPACVAFSAILGLSTPLALLATVAATAASPFYMPWLAAVLGGYQLTINPGEMSLHLLLIVGGAGVAAFLVKRFAPKLVRDNPDAMTGIAVFALVLAGLGSMRGMQAYFLAQPIVTLKLLALAYCVTLGFQCIGTNYGVIGIGAFIAGFGTWLDRHSHNFVVNLYPLSPSPLWNQGVSCSALFARGLHRFAVAAIVLPSERSWCDGFKNSRGVDPGQIRLRGRGGPFPRNGQRRIQSLRGRQVASLRSATRAVVTREPSTPAGPL
jgi:BASS family bile acid:Na+ symporter